MNTDAHGSEGCDRRDLIRVHLCSSVANFLLLLTAIGCATDAADEPRNPSFPVTYAHAIDLLRYDAKHPRRLRRPLLVVGGFGDPGVAAPRLRDVVRRATGDDRVAAVSLGLDLSLTECRDDIVAAADKAFPEPGTNQTAEVDVVGISMGGLAARYAALSETGHRRLRIARLFTISSPLRGATLADAVPFDGHPLQSEMRTGSPLYRWIDAWPQQPADLYGVYSYVRLHDGTVGAANAAVPGVTPWWVQPPPLRAPHDGAFGDARILADIVTRLRGEPPLTRDPPAPLPTDH